MRRSARTPQTMTIPTTHHLKPQRRCSLLASNLDVSIRFTSIFVITVAICEFSGLSQAVADAYTAVTLRLATPTETPHPSILPFRSRPRQHPFLNAVDAQDMHTHTSPAPNHRRRALFNLYKGIHPDASVEYAMSTRRLPTPPPTAPSFILESHWPEDSYNIRVCRIHNACLQKNGAILVHPSLKNHEDKLHECVVHKVEYMKSPSEFVGNSTTAAFDLFGHTPNRFHIPHFLTDILSMLFAIELIRPTSTHPSARSECIHPTLEKCPPHITTTRLRTATYNDDRVLTMSVSSWVPQLAAMLPGHPYLYFPSTLFENTDSACFRSIVTFSHNNYPSYKSEWLGHQNRLFERYGLSRRSMIRAPFPARVGRPAPRCKVLVLIINRVGWERRHSLLLGRDIVNVEDVKSRIERSAYTVKTPQLSVAVEVEYFENKTFVEQVDIMQRADVIVGVHGAGLSNMLFARNDTPVIEVFPFAYYAGPFPGVAGALNLRYTYVVAEPDTKTFLECMEVRARAVGDPNVSRKAKELWTEALRQRKEDGELEYLQTHKYHAPAVANMKVCARTQRMKVNVAEVSKRVIQMSQRACGGPVQM